MKRLIILAGLTATLSGPAMADICAYKPSRLIGAGTTGVISTGSASLAAVGLSMKAAGFYTLTYAASGAAMLASTAGGASAAGTVGIMGGTAGTIGTVSASTFLNLGIEQPSFMQQMAPPAAAIFSRCQFRVLALDFGNRSIQGRPTLAR